MQTLLYAMKKNMIEFIRICDHTTKGEEEYCPPFGCFDDEELNLVNEILSYIPVCTSLKILDLSCNSLYGGGKEVAHAPQKLPALTQLILHFCTGIEAVGALDIAKAVQDHASIEDLVLARNEI